MKNTHEDRPPTPGLRTTNALALYAESMGKVFRVTYIAADTAEANLRMERNPGEGAIAEDGHGRIYLAELYGSVAPSAIMADVRRNPPKRL